MNPSTVSEPNQLKSSAQPPVFQRTPRTYAQIPQDEVVIQSPPAAVTESGVSAVTILLPVVGSLMTIVCAVLVGTMINPWMALVPLPMMLLSGVAGIYRYRREKSRFKDQTYKREKMYAVHLNQISQRANELMNEQRRVSQLAHPEPAECYRRVLRLDPRLWERSPGDADFLHLRVGAGTSPISFSVKPPAINSVEAQFDPLVRKGQEVAARFQLVDGIPVTIPLDELGMAAVIGPRTYTASSLRAMILQLVSTHAPDQVKIVLTYPQSEFKEWNWARWLPHIWDEDRKNRYLSGEPGKAAAMLGALETTLRQRRLRQKEDSRAGEDLQLPVYVFVFADPNLVSGPESVALGPLMRLLLEDGRRCGAYGLFLTEQPEQVPQGCRGLLQYFSNQTVLTLVGPPRQEIVVRPDQVDGEQADRFARTLAPVRLQSLSQDSELPGMVTLLELLGISEVDDLPLPEIWAQSTPFRSLAVPIGVNARGDPLMLDLHERGHGPHGLVAGATGAGKSELLQTFIVSLSSYFSPHEVAFILIDYKGGGMANVFRELPHQIGIITNLEGNQAMRALSALRAELKRRQRLFDQAGVTHIDDYQRLRRGNLKMEPLPHLVVISDEFAELIQNQPEFMQGLISAVRVGRSLGVHLILATQKPAGVVNDQIWGNTRFRLCLRVEQAQDSKEVLKRPDAAAIRQPGRAYFQVGMDEVFEMFQAGYAGARYQPGSRSIVGQRDVAQVDLSGKRQRLSVAPKVQRENVLGQSQLKALVSYIHDSAQEQGIQPLSGPWLPPLPEMLVVDEARDAHSGWDGKTWCALNDMEDWFNPVVGLSDDPENQQQSALRFPLGKGGHLFVFGSPGSGKTVFLQTLITSLVKDHTPEELHLYVMDFGGRLLKVFEPLPQVGGVILPEEEERIQRLMQYLLQEMERRKSLFSEAGVGSSQAYRRQSMQQLAEIVVVLDNYLEFSRTYPDLVENLERIAREGGGLGIHLAFSANSLNGVTNRLLTNFGLMAALELTDAVDYNLIVGRTGGLRPEAGIVGRGLVRGTPPLEFQTALPAAGDSDQERTAALRAMVSEMAAVWSGKPAPAIRTLSEEVPLSAVLQCSEVWKEGVLESPSAVLGIHAETLELFSVSLSDGPHFLVSGAMSGGKTALLQTWIVSLAEKYPPDRLRLYLNGLESSRMLPFSQIPHCAGFFEDNPTLQGMLAEIEAELDARRTALESARRGADMFIDEQAFIAQYPALVLVVDDFDLFRQAVSEENRRKIDVILKKRNLGLHFIAAGPVTEFMSSMDPLAKALRTNQTGFLMGSNDPADLGLFNLRQVRGKSMPPGRGFFVRRGKTQTFQAAAVWIGTPDLAGWIQHIIQKRKEGQE